MKSIFAFVGIIISAFVSYALSDAVAEGICSTSMKDSNGKKLMNIIDRDNFVDDYASYLENLGYGIRIDKDKFMTILESDVIYEDAIAEYVNNINGHSVDERENLIANIREGYAVYITDVVSKSLSKYATETSARLVREDAESMQKLIPMLMEPDDIHPAAWYIAEKYVSPAYHTLTRLISFVVLFIFIALIIVCSINAFLGRREQSMINMSSHITGGVFGLLTSVFIIFAIAVSIRIWSITGDNEMLFFNNEAVEKTYVFRYFYDFAMKM